MKLVRFFALLLLTLGLIARAGAQSTTTFSLQVVAPPSCVITLLASPVSTSGTKLYAGQAGIVNYNISACSAASAAATATLDGVSTPVVFVAAAGTTPASLSSAITAAQATVGTHSLILTVPQPTMAMNAPLLPNAKVGAPYTASLPTLTGLKGGVPPYTWSIATGSLPLGLSLSSNGNVSGTPLTAMTSSFNFTVKDSSGL